MTFVTINRNYVGAPARPRLERRRGHSVEILKASRAARPPAIIDSIMLLYIYIYICMYVCMYIYIYIYRERERERERDR